jgi:hypothetical protein
VSRLEQPRQSRRAEANVAALRAAYVGRGGMELWQLGLYT